jgi:hypothetical protein
LIDTNKTGNKIRWYIQILDSLNEDIKRIIEAVYRRTYNTVRKDKSTNNDLLLSRHEPHLKPGVNSGAPEG